MTNSDRSSPVATWSEFEGRVRTMANYIWDRPCKPTQIGGVNIDGVIEINPGFYILIEITERQTLNKVREDVTKLAAARMALFTKNIYAQCYCIIEGNVTPAMKAAAEPHNTQVLTGSDFEKQFFDFHTYRFARLNAPFGSAVNPFTGARDDTAYVPVRYMIDGAKRDVDIKEIVDLLHQGRHIILLGEYGSGKSRCIKEVFSQLGERAQHAPTYPVAIDLRESWGLKRAGELVRRHFTDLGLEGMQSQAVKAALRHSIIYLLDGFDEIGSQAWSNDDQQLKSIRLRSLEGVRDLVSKSNAGILVSGREHYFPSNDEMINALGVNRLNTIILRAKTEFSDEEMAEYFEQRNIDAIIPSWLPRRPLMCQAVSDMLPEEVARFFDGNGDEAGFWDHFLEVISSRDARINASFNAQTILQVMVSLGRLTRGKPSNVGPISLGDVQQAFEFAVGRMPVEEASVMLQRLPGLGRIGTDSVERQFIDTAILDCLRANDILGIAAYQPTQFATVGSETWINPLGDLGQRLVSQKGGAQDLLRSARTAATLPNKTLACDFIGSLSRGEGDRDFGGIRVDNGKFEVLDLAERSIANLTLENCYFGNLHLPDVPPRDVKIMGCLASRVRGVTSIAAVPQWIEKLQADSFDSAENVALIRRIGLSPQHEILLTIIRKTFFQKGAGRKEEALLRGLGNVASPSTLGRIVNLLLREGLITRFRGNEGFVYSPNRQHAARMNKLMEELKGSGDPLWTEVENL